MTKKIERFFDDAETRTPCLVVDLDRVVENHACMAELMTWGEIFYAVKANPAPEIIARLAASGCAFDAASPSEVAACLKAGIAPDRISYGNTVKKLSDISFAAGQGVDLFAFDSVGEIEKLAAGAPGSSVVCRVVVSNDGARWPLTRKFGCHSDEAVALLKCAAGAGLRPAGISFHVGSQQTDPARWCEAITLCADLFARAADAGLSLDVLNLGGGFPVPYGDGAVPELETLSNMIDQALDEAFSGARPRVIVEPGRAIVANAGVIRSEVILVAERAYDTTERWVYLDVGRYGGLAESEGEAIRYRMDAVGCDGPSGPVVVAGPTCDSHDVLYENAMCVLPLVLKAGDIVTLHDTGAYTSTYASVGFNGFAPLEEHYI
ncbi:MAG: type III PLP-dependent enzyme [Rhodospirillaceae bacterium]|jgi:ornithine decarboxylase|nr:type III PLP-dependent enzyme [Rhodospirillaceae bacterium]MBT3809019.1 type III PLP-dependent enzyme [Rhodospirillaceae bacterium]MBT5357235.1 type III PLP-dependent enzyme [Rhodospirillaceae bacterium]MBT5770309.1 type III PLP-dependent enzyme [Rhodospirillaceae bacterium]MBT6311058.1 type III PLP-dependent enzyme [Rhodospirillaceae bacterium]